MVCDINTFWGPRFSSQNYAKGSFYELSTAVGARGSTTTPVVSSGGRVVDALAW